MARLLRKAPSPQDIAQVARMYGSYLGEVFRRVGGGDWVLDPDIVPGQDTLCVRTGEQRVWPVAKVHKRILSGSEDNVWAYSRVVMKKWS